MNRSELLAYVKNEYGIEPEYPWMSMPDNAILRNTHNRKWFAALLRVKRSQLGLAGDEPVDIVNLKVDLADGAALTLGDGIFPGYHMNHRHWISVLLDSNVPDGLIESLIADSRALTA